MRLNESEPYKHFLAILGAHEFSVVEVCASTDKFSSILNDIMKNLKSNTSVEGYIIRV